MEKVKRMRRAVAGKKILSYPITINRIFYAGAVLRARCGHKLLVLRTHPTLGRLRQSAILVES
jgi:hypothetical protein